MSTRVILNPDGDVEEEKKLIPFAKLRQSILHNLMSFQDLKQDQSSWKDLINGSVVRVKSCFNEDRIEIYCPLSKKEVIPIIPQCLNQGTMFISVNASNDIEFYRYENDEVTLVRTLNANSILSPALPTDWAQRPDVYQQVGLMFAEGGMNSLVVLAMVTNWRGNVVDQTSNLWEVFNDYYPVKIPIDFYGDDKIEAGIRHQFASRSPMYNAMSQSGLLVYYSGVVLFGQGYFFGQQPLDQYELRYPSSSTGLFEALTNARFIRAIGIYRDYAILIWMKLASSSSPLEMDIRLVSVWGWGETPVAVCPLTEVYSDGTTLKANAISQILGYDSKIYVFYGYTIASTLQDTIEIAIYDLELNIIKDAQTIEGITGSVSSRASIISSGGNNYLCFRTAHYVGDSYGTLSTSDPVYLVDPETLELKKSISMPSSNVAFAQYESSWTMDQVPSFLAVNAPITNYMLDQINTYRFAQSPHIEGIADQVNYPMKTSYLGYSCKLESCAKLHADWCAANGKVQHEDADGNLVYVRSQVFGFRYTSTGENMAFIDTTVFKTEEEQINEVLRLWKESPGHNLNLINRDLNTMGYATAMIPSTFHKIYIGPGGYNIEEGDIELDPSQYGKIKIFVYDVAEG
jgi:hypothetical protein